MDEATARLTALIMVLLLGLYSATGNVGVVSLVTVDFLIRGWTRWQFSPASWIGSRIARRLGVPTRQIAKAPKIFAARVGPLLALMSFGLFFIAPAGSVTVALVLLGCAMLEAVLNICVGCYVYTYLVLPWFRFKA